MLKKIVSHLRGESSAHPLASRTGAEAMLADIPVGNPERTLFDIDHWLGEALTPPPELDPARVQEAVGRLDEAAVSVVAECLTRYFDADAREHLSEQWWQTLVTHCERVAAIYGKFLQSPRRGGELSSSERKLLAAMAVRSMYWLMQGKKFLRLRYRSPEPAWWQQVHNLLALSHALGLAALRQPLYDEIAGDTTVWQEYALGLYFDLAPVGNLSPPQIATLDLLLRPLVGHLGIKADPAGASHAVDLTGTAGPVKLGPQSPAGPQWRYLGTAQAYSHLLRLAAEIRAQKALPKAMEGAPATQEDTEALIKALIVAWSREPPKRRRQRHADRNELLVVHGFPIARRMVAFSDFARSGRSIDYRSDLALVLRERIEAQLAPEERERAAAARAEVPDPMAVLRTMELAGDRAMMEKWALVDVSEGGLGAVIPHLRSIHRVGGLVGYRFADQLDWRLAVVRRLGRNPAGQPGIGLEALAGPSVCAQVKPAVLDGRTIWQQMEGSGLGYLDALLVSREGDELVLPGGAYVAELAILLRVGGQERQVVLAELRERGPDFDWVRFRPAP